MAGFESIAAAAAAGDERVVAGLAAGLLRPLKNNFVERPWGGDRLRDHKGLYPLREQSHITGLGLGEAFEISACDDDEEARAHPSRIRFEDGSELSLAQLLRCQGAALLGRRFTDRFGSRFPLLPKTLCIKELLSVQGHPPGHTEAYIIIDAQPGATIRIGFNRDLEPGAWTAELVAGRELQRRLLGMLESSFAVPQLQSLLQGWFADRAASGVEVSRAAYELCGSGVVRAELEALLERLKALYWRVLDSMNTLIVQRGDVIYNANPPRIAAATGRPASAEVHALGNPERQEILALEIRCPGPTYRAWDHVRFPLRRLDVEAAVGSLNLRRTQEREFRVVPVPLPRRTGVFRSVADARFLLEHLRPELGAAVAVPAEPPHCLHVVRGRVEVRSALGTALGCLARGESAIVPIGVGAYEVIGAEGDPEVIKVGLPELVDRSTKNIGTQFGVGGNGAGHSGAGSRQVARRPSSLGRAEPLSQPASFIGALAL